MRKGALREFTGKQCLGLVEASRREVNPLLQPRHVHQAVPCWLEAGQQGIRWHCSVYFGFLHASLDGGGRSINMCNDLGRRRGNPLPCSAEMNAKLQAAGGLQA